MQRWSLPGPTGPVDRSPQCTAQRGTPMTSVQGTAVDIRTEDGVADAYLAHPGDGAPRPGVLLYQDAFGLRPHLRAMADRLAEAGYTVLVPNVFYRHGRAPVVEAARVHRPGRASGHLRGPGPAHPVPHRRGRRAGRRGLSAVAGGEPAGRGRPGGADRVLHGRPARAVDGRMAIRTGSRRWPVSTAGGSRPTRRTAPTWRPSTSRPSCTSATPTTTTPCRPSRSSASRRPSRRRASGTRARSTPAAEHGYTQADTAAYDEKGAERHWAALLDLLKRTF